MSQISKVTYLPTDTIAAGASI